MPRGDRSNWGGHRTATRPDAKKAGRPKASATVRLPIDDARAVLNFLNAQHETMDVAHPAERGMAFLIAGLWSEVSVASDRD